MPVATCATAGSSSPGPACRICTPRGPPLGDAQERSVSMGELSDKAKGKVKETLGTATGDRKLEAEGKVDTAKGKVKGAFEEVKQTVKDATRPPPPEQPKR